MEQRSISKIKVGKRYRKDLGDLSELEESIKEIGLLHPIVIKPNNTLVAGRRRLMACKNLGWNDIPVNVVNIKKIVMGEYDENVMRKDFSNSEAYDIYQEILPLEEKEAEKRQIELGKTHGIPSGESPQGGKGRAKDRASKKAGRSRQTMERTKEIIDFAYKNNRPELITILDRKSVDAAYKEMKKIRRELENKKLAEKAKSLLLSDRYNIFVGDICKVELEPNSIDVIITDPPYPEKYLPLWMQLGIFAKRHLKIGGVLLAMTPAPYLPEVIKMLGESLEYQWILSCVLPGSHGSVIQYGVRNVMWKPVLVYRNKGTPVNIGSDLFENDKRDKEFHEWGQGVGGYIWQVENFSKPNDLICDPFLGGGTTAMAVASLKEDPRRFIGFDIDEDKVNTAKGRLPNV